MKLIGTGRPNRGVQFAHNTYFGGEKPNSNRFEKSVFENNLVIAGCEVPNTWTKGKLATFFPTAHNLLWNGDRYCQEFAGLTANPQLGNTPETLFVLQPDSPAINAGRLAAEYPQENVTDGQPDLGALEYGETVEDWRHHFGHCGPSWITRENATDKAPCRPPWPAELDPRWGGL